MGKVLFTNNARKIAGIPMRRKKNDKKRYYTRNRADEDIESVWDYWNGRWDNRLKWHIGELLNQNGDRCGKG